MQICWPAVWLRSLCINLKTRVCGIVSTCGHVKTIYERCTDLRTAIKTTFSPSLTEYDWIILMSMKYMKNRLLGPSSQLANSSRCNSRWAILNHEFLMIIPLYIIGIPNAKYLVVLTRFSLICILVHLRQPNHKLDSSEYYWLTYWILGGNMTTRKPKWSKTLTYVSLCNALETTIRLLPLTLFRWTYAKVYSRPNTYGW